MKFLLRMAVTSLIASAVFVPCGSLGQIVETRGRTLNWQEGWALPSSVSGDLDGDGKVDDARLGMRPHDARHDVVLKFGDGKFHVLIVAFQPSQGPVVHRGIRLLAVGSHQISCLRDDAKDIQPCAPQTVMLRFGGLDIYAPGGTRHLVWWDGTKMVAARAVALDTAP